MINKFNNPLRIFSWSIVLVTSAFLINNILNFWYSFPGVDKFFANYNFFFENKRELTQSEIFKSWLQFSIYIIAIAPCVIIRLVSPWIVVRIEKMPSGSFGEFILQPAIGFFSINIHCE